MHIRGFDGLRALAMFLVFLTHKTVWGATGQLGFSGVWIFFLLSGYLITAQLHAARSRIEQDSTSLRREMTAFWLRRAMRIFPAYYVLLALLVPFYTFSGRDVPGLPYYLSYLSNFYFQLHPQEFHTTWAHFWTLAVEEQFYLFFAPLLLLVPARRAALACTLVVLVSLVQRFTLAGAQVDPYVVYIDSLVNFGLLAFGGLIHLQRAAFARILAQTGLDHAGIGWLAMFAVVAMSPLARALAGPDLILLQVLYLVGGALASLLLMNICLNQDSGLVRLLEWRPIAYYGRISYGLYLYNDYIKTDIPERILRAMAPRLWSDGNTPDWVAAVLYDGSTAYQATQFAGILVCLAVLVGIAHLSWILIEKPALHLRGRLTKGRDKSGPTAARRERVATADATA